MAKTHNITEVAPMEND